jgi:hypothetical protein
MLMRAQKHEAATTKHKRMMKKICIEMYGEMALNAITPDHLFGHDGSVTSSDHGTVISNLKIPDCEWGVSACFEIQRLWPCSALL